jgi:ABC-2 type transport system ATP-binding protein
LITVKGLKKSFGSFAALKGLDMRVEAGQVYGFIGQNGAGKTTTMNILAGLSRPAEGECIVNRRDVLELTSPGDLGIGYLPEDPKFYPWLTAGETLKYLAGTHDADRISRIIQWTGLAAAQNRRVGGFSRGMKQRLGIGAALIRNPDLLILDEPSSALDPEGRRDVLRLIHDLKNMGKTILFSTHVLDDVERICDTVGMIDAGRMVFEKSLAQLQMEHGQPIFEVTPVAAIHADTLAALSRLPGIASVVQAENFFTVRATEAAASIALMGFLAGREIAVKSFALRKARLEDLFLKEAHRR